MTIDDPIRDPAGAAYRHIMRACTEAAMIPGVPDKDRVAILRMRSIPALRGGFRTLGPVMDDPETAFIDTWRNIARVCERGLADPAYPDDCRESLYRMLSAARECADAGWEATR